MLGVFVEEEEIDYEPSFTASTPAATFEYKKGVKNVPPVVSETDSPEPKKRKVGTIKESNERRLRGRQKQIDYVQIFDLNMTTFGRRQRKREDPRTPDKYQVCSKRSWDGQISKWRRQLHVYDPE